MVSFPDVTVNSKVSAPDPPIRVSLLDPPNKTSLPLPPIRIYVASEPQIISSPLPPLIVIT